ncbi:MAG: hypothetical protein ABIU63_03630 [Chitinophagaceae bacterium]
MNSYIETALSLVFIFFIFSIIAYIIQEIVAINLEYRGRLLWRSMAQLLDGFRVDGRGIGKKQVLPANSANTTALFDHPQIKTLRKQLNRLPSYIPASNFALAVMDLVSKNVPADAPAMHLFDKVKLGLKQLPAGSPEIYTVLENLVATSADIKELQQKIEQWFNDYMTRVTGWYKSNTVITIRIIAVAVTVFFNINVLKLTREIFTNAQLRGVLTSAAMNMEANQQLMDGYVNKARSAALDSVTAFYGASLSAAKNAVDSTNINKKMADAQAAAADAYTIKSRAAIDTLYQQINTAGIPLGWNAGIAASILVKDATGKCAFAESFFNILWLLLGWAIAAGCISMGAPFWFDVLSKLVNVRRAGLVPATEAGKK